MNGQIDDKAFEEYLRRGSPVSKHYQALESDEVPAGIDSQILAQAEEAVRSPKARKTRAWQRWSVPIALAASTVLAISIVIESGQHESTLTRAPSYAEPARDTPSATPQTEERKAEPRAESEVIRPAAAPATASEAISSGAAEREQEARALREQVQRRSEAQAAAAPPPPEALAKRAELKAESDGAVDTRSEGAREKQTEELNDEALPAGSRVSTRPAAPAPAVTTPRSPSATSARVESPGFMSQKENAEAQRSDPETWLREIRKLRAAGKTEEADREWKAFRESFPNHSVAEDDPAIGP